MTSSGVADEALAALDDDDRELFEDKLIGFAKEASIEHMGPLDVAPLRNMPADLPSVRKRRIGRHRAYYVGHHKDCTYRILWVKRYKKDDKINEYSAPFERVIRRASNEGGAGRLMEAKAPDPASQPEERARPGPPPVGEDRQPGAGA